MSSGPTLTGTNCIEATSRPYTNIDITENDYCTYTGHCQIARLVFHREDACIYCKYRKLLDIPAMIDQKLEERKT